MANNYFQFKQFLIHQRYCAMKVTTDACLFGAWVAERVGDCKRVLDIGAGTGLLTLMVAQKTNDAQIDAVEIDSEAAKEAATNFKASPWNERVDLIRENIIKYKVGDLYDFIITNPPFFNNDLKSDSNKRNLAMHSEALSLDELLVSIERLLKAGGLFAILLPTHRSVEFEGKALLAGFYLREKVLVKQTPKHPPFRSMLLFGHEQVIVTESELVIKENDSYTADFIALLKDYYLYL